MDKKEKLKELEIEVNSTYKHVCTQMSLNYPDPMVTTGLELDIKGKWNLATHDCYPGLSDISYCPYCGKKL